MAQQKIVWTVLPYGVVREGPLQGRLRCSIVVSPRLTPANAAESVLSAFPTFLVWPEVLERLRFELEVDGQSVPLEPQRQPDPALWRLIFPEDTPVTAFEFKDMATVNLRSYGVRNVLGFLKHHYSALAASAGTRRPRLLPFTEAAEPLREMLYGLGTSPDPSEREFDGFDRLISSDKRSNDAIERGVFSEDSELRGSIFDITGKLRPEENRPLRALPVDWGNLPDSIQKNFRTAAEYSFFQADRFYRRPEMHVPWERRDRRPSKHQVEPPPVEPTLDFHRRLATFSDMPELMRDLGLVIDVVLPLDNPLLAALGASASGAVEGTCGLVVHWDGHDLTADAFPTTAWRLTRTRFVTRAHGDEIRDGMLDLEGASDAYDEKTRSRFDVYQVDPDGAALKTVNFLLSAQRLITKSEKPGDGEITYTTGDEQGVAALRSVGIGVACHDRAQLIALGAAGAALKNTAFETSAAASRRVVLFAEDVLRGYRVDVQDQSAGGEWRSLCQRDSEYRLERSNVTRVLQSDEGYVKGAGTSSGENPEDHYLHESIFRWTGWSLVAPRPGRTIRSESSPDSGMQSEHVTEVSDQAKSGTGVFATFRVARGSLPRLRFGHRYRLRARVVDIAGNSLGLAEVGDGDDSATELVTCQRYEPVDPPALVLRSRLSEGESTERMVIRSDFDCGAEAYNHTLGTPFDKAKDRAAFDYTSVNERHFVPPKSSQQQAETHGMFDAAIGGQPDAIHEQYRIAVREAGTLFDQTPGSDVRLITPPGAQGVITTELPLKPPSPGYPTGERLVGGQYVIHAEAALQTPYLPDPAAGGVALRGVPGLKNLDTLGPGTRIVGLPDSKERVLLITYDGAWPHCQGLRLVLAELGETTNAECEPSQPQEAPKWDPEQRVLVVFLPKGRIARLRYASFIDSRFIAPFGIAGWVQSPEMREAIQALAGAGAHWMLTPDRPLVLVHATQHPVCEPAWQALRAERTVGSTHADLSGRLRLHGPSTGKLEVLGTWKEWVDDPALGDPERIKGRAQLAEQALPENQPNQFSLTTPADGPDGAGGAGGNQVRPNRHEFGDTRFRLIRYQIKATTRFREYLPPALTEKEAEITRIGPALVMPQEPIDTDPGAPVQFTPSPDEVHRVVIPSSARPLVPRVAYVVPTFRWEPRDASKPLQSTLRSTRLGGGLRVYLERPWFSSGDGELLGVVLLGEGVSRETLAQNGDSLPFVTQWGLDPIFDAELPPAQMKATNFPARVQAEEVELDEVPGQRVFVVGHRVQWDATRKLWFCDIELALLRSYFPFVRLALVRYQPNSLPQVKTSRVVLADFAQVVPRRKVTAERNGGIVRITVQGPAPERGSADFRRDSPFVEFSPAPGHSGTPPETGRNRFEIALQTRDPALNTDLAWTDDARAPAVSSLIDPPSGELTPGPPASTGEVSNVFAQLDPPIWHGTFDLPANLGGPARLVVREYERFYADRTEPANIDGRSVHKRVIEERLVYAETFAL